MITQCEWCGQALENNDFRWVTVNDGTKYFCDNFCRDRFSAARFKTKSKEEPKDVTVTSGNLKTTGRYNKTPDTTTTKGFCDECENFARLPISYKSHSEGRTVYFCSKRCKEIFHMKRVNKNKVLANKTKIKIPTMNIAGIAAAALLVSKILLPKPRKRFNVRINFSFDFNFKLFFSILAYALGVFWINLLLMFGAYAITMTLLTDAPPLPIIIILSPIFIALPFLVLLLEYCIGYWWVFGDD